jgi:hypothetical protein
MVFLSAVCFIVYSIKLCLRRTSLEVRTSNYGERWCSLQSAAAGQAYLTILEASRAHGYATFVSQFKAQKEVEALSAPPMYPPWLVPQMGPGTAREFDREMEKRKPPQNQKLLPVGKGNVSSDEDSSS